MTKKQKKVLYQIIAAVILIVILKLLPAFPTRWSWCSISSRTSWWAGMSCARRSRASRTASRSTSAS